MKCVCPVCGKEYEEQTEQTEADFLNIELVGGRWLRPCNNKHSAREIWLAWRRAFELEEL
jgi:hypothetical protein